MKEIIKKLKIGEMGKSTKKKKILRVLKMGGF